MVEKLSSKENLKYKEFDKEDLQVKLARLSRICQNLEIPVMVLVDGWESSARGKIVGDFIKELNPKYYDVDVFDDGDDKVFPILNKAWLNIPSKGNFKIFVRSYYYKLLENPSLKKKEFEKEVESFKKFEKKLYDDKTIILKFFIDISKDEQKDRIDDLKDSVKDAFYIDQLDRMENKDYKEYKKHFSKVIDKTNFDTGKWNIIDADDTKLAAKEVLGLAIEELTQGIERISNQNKDKDRSKRSYDKKAKIIEKLDLTKSLTRKDYDKKKDKLQKEVADMMYEYYSKNISTVLVFEGVDAAGKDGAIERLIKDVDPRLYKVNAISSPNEKEASKNYLWRFYKRLPEPGYVGIFSRSWYGRVMVERIEKFATVSEWDRVYGEMIDFEKDLVDNKTLLIKFFVVIDKEEQLERFRAREAEPDKQYKITDEDWRNRDKWDEYIKAMNEMLDRTNVSYAPWIIVEGNDKKYARIKVMEEYLKLAKKFLKDLD